MTDGRIGSKREIAVVGGIEAVKGQKLTLKPISEELAASIDETREKTLWSGVNIQLAK